MSVSGGPFCRCRGTKETTAIVEIWGALRRASSSFWLQGEQQKRHNLAHHENNNSRTKTFEESLAFPVRFTDSTRPRLLCAFIRIAGATQSSARRVFSKFYDSARMQCA